MGVQRREVLRAVGGSVALGLFDLSDGLGVTDRVFVHPRSDRTEDALAAVAAVGGTTLLEYDNFDFVAAAVPSTRLDELRDHTRVAWVEDDDDVGVPGGWSPSLADLLDPGRNIDCSTHPAQRASWGWERIGAGAVDQDGSGVDVGILDTGIESDHCSLSVAGGRNFSNSGLPTDYEDRHGHGTHVAGVAGALDNGLGVVGVAPGVNLYAVKVLDDNGSGSYSTLVAGIDWCMSNDVELISMSLGGGSGSSTVDRAVEEATEAGHLLLSAAGNEGNDGDGDCDEETMLYPASHRDVVAVTAMDEDDTIASYSSVGESADLLAPGTRILSTYVDNQYARASGTSVACPFVTGVAALKWEAREESGPGPNEQVRGILEETAESVLGTCEEGHGLVDAPGTIAQDEPQSIDDDQGSDDGQTDTGNAGDEPTPTGPADGDDEPIAGRSDQQDDPMPLEQLANVLEAIVNWLLGLFG